MESYSATMIGDVRHERSLILLSSLTDPDNIKQSVFMSHEINVLKTLALKYLHRQKSLKEYAALQLLEE